MTEPEPLQVGQVRSIVKNPCCWRTRPLPSQVGQPADPAVSDEPDPLQESHVSFTGILILASLPL